MKQSFNGILFLISAVLGGNFAFADPASAIYYIIPLLKNPRSLSADSLARLKSKQSDPFLRRRLGELQKSCTLKSDKNCNLPFENFATAFLLGSPTTLVTAKHAFQLILNPLEAASAALAPSQRPEHLREVQKLPVEFMLYDSSEKKILDTREIRNQKPTLQFILFASIFADVWANDSRNIDPVADLVSDVITIRLSQPLSGTILFPAKNPIIPGERVYRAGGLPKLTTALRGSVVSKLLWAEPRPGLASIAEDYLFSADCTEQDGVSGSPFVGAKDEVQGILVRTFLIPQELKTEKTDPQSLSTGPNIRTLLSGIEKLKEYLEKN